MNAMVEAFEEHRPLMFSIAYRMLGTVADAEDMLQEAFLRWQQTEMDTVTSPKAFLAATTTRLCIDYLQSARVRREQYVGPWLPEPLVSEPTAQAANDELAESLSMAFLMMLENLSPAERAIFLLHDIFSFDFEETARLVGKTAANCRKIASRARRQLTQAPPRFVPDPDKANQLATTFLGVCKSGDLNRLVAILADDVTLYSDGGGKVPSATRPIQGALNVARFLLGVVAKAPRDMVVKTTLVNRRPGLIVSQDGVNVRIFSLEFDQTGLRTICVVGNPEKLRHLPTALNSAP